MKIKLISAFLLALTIVLATSCYSSRKTGCPMGQQTTGRFRV